MKILMLFCDMLRADFFNTYNKKRKPNRMDAWFNKLGGTVYTNAFTPAPDTGRSLACLFTGQYPRNNGCTFRYKYPRENLNPEIESMFSLLLKNGFKIIVQSSKEDEVCGSFPLCVDEDENAFKDINLEKILSRVNRSLNTDEKLFTFISLQDSHMACSDYDWFEMGVNKGIDQLASAFDLIFSKIDMNVFDYIILFSDHGLKINPNDWNKDLLGEKAPGTLNKDRSHIVLQIKKKNDKGIIKNDNLRSILDVFPYLFDELKMKYNNVDGFNIELEKPREIVLEEEIYSPPSLLFNHCLWAVRTPEYYYIRRLRDYFLYDYKEKQIQEPSKEILDYLDEKIESLSYSFKNKKKMHESTFRFQSLPPGETPAVCYTDGIRRPKIKKTLWFKIYRKYKKREMWLKKLLLKISFFN